ncbi:MAG: hypothetical protein NTW99_08730 [Chloroflexi bacterium]|nr:hypothetical protein [Chloroflexota bacterium]
MAKKELSLRLLCATAVAGFALSSCVPATPAIGGIVQGAIYGDLNSSGAIDPGEGVLEDAEVTLAEYGPNQTQGTAADGCERIIQLHRPAGRHLLCLGRQCWLDLLRLISGTHLPRPGRFEPGPSDFLQPVHGSGHGLHSL